MLIIGIKGLLVGERAAPPIEEEIKKATLSIPQVKEVVDLRTMQIGSDKVDCQYRRSYAGRVND